MTEDESMELAWEVHPFADERAKGLSAMAVILGAISGSFAWGGPLLGIVATLILVGGTGSFFVRTRYRLTATEVVVQSPFQRVNKPWSAFRRAHPGDQGVSLSPFRKRHVLDPYRSVMLRYGDCREEVLAWVDRFGPARETPSPERAKEE